MSQQTADTWALAALLAWGRGGLRAVAVEPLARELGVTKGSFYWHFKSRAELVRAAVDYWAREGTQAVIARLDGVKDPRARLAALFEASWDRLDYLKTEAAMGAAYLAGEEMVVDTYRSVQARRLEYVEAIYRELGLEPGLARRHAIAAYSAFLGSLQMVALEVNGLTTEQQLREQVQVFQELLIPLRCGE